MTKLLGFDYDIQFRPSLENKVVDVLSQMPTTTVPTLFALSVPYVVDLGEIDPQVTRDPRLCNIISDLLVAPDSQLGFSLLHGLLFYKTYVGPSFCSPLIPLLLQEGYASPIGGHSGVLKTFKRLAASFY